MKCVHSVVCDWCIFTSTHMYVYMYIDYLASLQLYFVYIINSSLVLVYSIQCVGQMYICMHNIVFSYILMCGYVHMLIVWSPNAFPEKRMYLGRGLHMSFYYHCTKDCAVTCHPYNPINMMSRAKRYRK